MKFVRVTMNTPAVTIVAACINADTGVGPAMASGSQIKSGICALLPVAPMNRPSASHDIKPNCQSCSRSEEHTSELQSQFQLVCRLLLEKKNADDTAGRSACVCCLVHIVHPVFDLDELIRLMVSVSGIDSL